VALVEVGGDPSGPAARGGDLGHCAHDDVAEVVPNDMDTGAKLWLDVGVRRPDDFFLKLIINHCL
jgi:hypothetical protein